MPVRNDSGQGSNVVSSHGKEGHPRPGFLGGRSCKRDKDKEKIEAITAKSIHSRSAKHKNDRGQTTNEENESVREKGVEGCNAGEGGHGRS